ncbi:MAG: hypothetical protein Salg2KO_10520 [Salibacteraceae bacterium]
MYSAIGNAQNMSINDDGSDPAASAMLDISDNSRGLLMPRLTQAQITSIASPATGLILYNTTDSVFQYFNGAQWLNAGAAGQDLSFVSPFVSISGGTPADITNILYKEHRLPDTLGVHLMSGNLVTDGNWINGDEDDEGIFVNFGGQVGIGNNAPTQLLDVSGIAEVDSLRINNTYALPTVDGTNGQIMTTNGLGITSWSNGVPDLDWTTGTGTVFNALDMVGIGTNTPNLTYNLSLNANAAGVGSTRGGLLIQNAVNGNRRKVGVLSVLNDGGNLAKFGHWSNITGKNSGNDTLASFYSVIDNNNAGDTAYGLYARYADNLGENYGVYAIGEDQNYFSGNVGIGTNSPNQELDVEGDIEIDGEYTYESTKTRYLSIPAHGFQLLNTISGTGTANTEVGGVSAGNYLYTTGSTGDLHLFAPIYLPDGAIVTDVDFYVYDNSGAGDCTGYMYRQNHTSTTNSFMAITPSTTVSSGAVQTLNDNTIADPTIDTQNYNYHLRYTARGNDVNLRLYSARITYTVTEAD